MDADPVLVEQLVREVLRELGHEGPSAAPLVREVLRELEVPASPPVRRPESLPLCRPRVAPRSAPFSAQALAAIQAATPARVAQGRTGTRYLTRAYIQLRAEHAIALDAVRSTVPDGFAERLGCLALASRARDHEEYLLYPGHGRRLCDESRALLQREGTHGADVQVIAGDGLSAWALLANAPDLLPALVSGLTGAGFRVGRPLFVRHARVGVQDEIGVLLGAQATAILVGERPGLGTGDSLSIYTAFRPRLDQDNAEKDCLSNIRPLGLAPVDAARECVDLLQRTFRAGGGGVHLTRSGT